MKNKTKNIIFQFPINVYLDHVDKKSGFITRLKNKSSAASDVFIANKVKEMLVKSNKSEEGNNTLINPVTQKPQPSLRNK